MDRESRFHLVFAALFVLSFVAGSTLDEWGPAWRDPQVRLSSFAIGVIWLTAFFMRRSKSFLDQQKVLRDRIERLEHRLRDLEDER
ncbi:MAG: hypothetical protein H6832_13385 [Planctomycetes bacterium]|nr:hypothetical protein [Planctomycetota bacterium]MCB9919389.1 hypothetical protein [Planctomycetota bacterium]